MVALAIPSLCFLIVIYILMGLNEFSTGRAIAISGFPSITINVWQGVKNVDNKLLGMSQSLQRKSLDAFAARGHAADYALHSRRVALRPGDRVEDYRGCRATWGRNSGIGFQLHYWFQLFNMPQVFAWTLFFTLVMLFVELAIFKQIEHYVFHWRPATKF